MPQSIKQNDVESFKLTIQNIKNTEIILSGNYLSTLKHHISPKYS